MKIFEYIAYHIQPLLGLLLGIVIVLSSSYWYWKTDGKAKNESGMPIQSRSMSIPVLKTISSIGIAIGGILIILAIKYLSS